jgi:hypothetical protein
MPSIALANAFGSEAVSANTNDGDTTNRTIRLRARMGDTPGFKKRFH